MLLAQVRSKVGSMFNCPSCEADISLGTGIEDALTSHVFGILRHLPARRATLPLLRGVGLDVEVADEPGVELWPFGSVRLVRVGESELVDLGVEPDATIDGRNALVTVEAKLGSKLGADPLQLPKQVVYSAAASPGRPWWLLCITTDSVEPSHHSFRVEHGRLVLGDLAPLANAVASYFDAIASIHPSYTWPLAADVLTCVRWTSWKAVARILKGAAGEEGIETWAASALNDLYALLQLQGIVTPEFQGFRFERRVLPAGISPIWRARDASLWSGLRVWSSCASSKGWLTAGEPKRLWSSIGSIVNLKFPAIWSEGGS